MLIWTKYHERGMMPKYLAPKKGNRVDQAINEEIPKLSPPILVQHKQSLLECHKIFKFWSSLLAQCILLIQTNCHKILYEYFSAMMTWPPDWPYLFGTLRDIPIVDITKTPS